MRAVLHIICALCPLVFLEADRDDKSAKKTQPLFSIEEILEEFERLNRQDMLEALKWIEEHHPNYDQYNLNEQILLHDALSDQYLGLGRDTMAQEFLGMIIPEIEKQGPFTNDNLTRALYFRLKATQIALSPIEGGPDPIELLKSSSEILSELGEQRLFAEALGELGFLLYQQGKYHEGNEVLREAAVNFLQVGEHISAADMLLEAGTTGVAVELTQVMAETLDILATYKEADDLPGMAYAYHNMGYDSADFIKAEDAFERAIHYADRSNDILTGLAARAGLSEISAIHEHYGQAHEYAQEALELADEIDDPHSKAHAHRVAGVAFASDTELAKYNLSEEHFGQALKIYENFGEEELKIECYKGLAELHLAKREYDPALEYARLAKDWEEENRTSTYRDTLYLVYSIYVAKEDYKSAVDILELYIEEIEREWKNEIIKDYENKGLAYERALKQSEIKLLQQENSLKAAKIAQQTEEIRYLSEIQTKGRTLYRLFAVVLFLTAAVVAAIVFLIQAKRSLIESKKRIEDVQLKEVELGSQQISEQLYFRQEIQRLNASLLKRIDERNELIPGNLLSSESFDISRFLTSNFKSYFSDIGLALSQAIEVSESSIQAAGLRLIRPEIPKDMMAHFDPERFKEAIVYMLRNAIFRAPGGSNIDFRVSVENKEQLEISFSDTGPGIPEEIIDFVYDCYSNSDSPEVKDCLIEKASLEFAKLIIEKLGGSVSAKNNPDGGASFIIRINLH